MFKWRKTSTLPAVAETLGTNPPLKVRPNYLLVVGGQRVPCVFAWIAEERIFTANGTNVHVNDVEACVPFGDLPFPPFVKRRPPTVKKESNPVNRTAKTKTGIAK